MTMGSTNASTLYRREMSGIIGMKFYVLTAVSHLALRTIAHTETFTSMQNLLL